MKSHPTVPWLLLALGFLATGCPSTLPESTDSSYTFPHSEGFGAGDQHGLAWFEDKDECLLCHDVLSTSAPTCFECHTGYPHDVEGWEAGSVHGPDATAADQTCDYCHGTGERQPADQPLSACRDCHESYPHRATWPLSSIHGPSFLAGETTDCSNCHGTDWQGSDISDGCTGCHPLFPHESATDSSAYMSPDRHGTDALSLGVTACGTACHGADYAGGESSVACTGCHPPFPHQGDYSVEHRTQVETYGEDACFDCHEDNSGHAAAFTCTTRCHGGAG